MAGAASEVYEPLNQYKPVARNIGIVDGPFAYLTTAGVRLPLPFTTRMTVVRLGEQVDLFAFAILGEDGLVSRERFSRTSRRQSAVRMTLPLSAAYPYGSLRSRGRCGD